MANKEKISWYKDPKIIISITIPLVAVLIGALFTLWLRPRASDFSISVSPLIGQTHPGGVIQTMITIEYIHNYKYPVTLSADEYPSDINITFMPVGEPTPPYSSTMTMNVGKDVPEGSYEIPVKGIGGDGKEHTCKYVLNVKPLSVTEETAEEEKIEETTEAVEETTEITTEDQLPDLSDAVITLQDLPSGFEEIPPATFGLTKETMSQGQFKVESLFTFLDAEHFEIIMGFTTLLPTKIDQSGFDLALGQPDFLLNMFIGGMGEFDILEKGEITGLDNIGDKSVGLTVVANVEGSPAPMRIDLAVFRRYKVGAFILAMYMEGKTPPAQIGEIANKLDKHIDEALSSNI